MRRAPDRETAPAANERGAAERGGHALSEQVGTLPCPRNDPKLATLEEMHRSLRDDPVHDGAARTDRWVADDVVEGHLAHRLVQVAESDLRVRDLVRGDVCAGQCDGPFVDVREDDVTAFRQARGDDPECTVATAQIQDQLARSYLEGGQQEFRSA